MTSGCPLASSFGMLNPPGCGSAANSTSVSQPSGEGRRELLLHGPQSPSGSQSVSRNADKLTLSDFLDADGDRSRLVGQEGCLDQGGSGSGSGSIPTRLQPPCPAAMPGGRSWLAAEASILCTPHFASLLKKGQLSPGFPPFLSAMYMCILLNYPMCYPICLYSKVFRPISNVSKVCCLVSVCCVSVGGERHHVCGHVPSVSPQPSALPV
jgi:hypothetical protein